MTALTLEQIQAGLRDLPRWTGDPTGIARTLTFGDFRAAMQFLQACVEDIERLGHHPAWRNVYNRVEIELVTHDAGNAVTALDLELARAIERVVAARGAELGLVERG